jgi:phosphoribosylanthranilate isomerase
MASKPYVGITGFKQPEEVSIVTRIFAREGFPQEHDYTAMLGILTSDKRLREPSVAGSRTPAVDDIRAIVEAAPSWSIPMLHYHQAENKGFIGNLEKLMGMTGCSAFQLNIAWPAVEEIAELKMRHPGFTLTYQLPRRAIEGDYGYLRPPQLAEKMHAYDGLADYALLDLSGGKGVPFSVSESKELLELMAEALPHACLGIAGGLSGSNLYEKVTALGREGLMFDAESGLMTDKALDLSKVDHYIREARRLT